MGSFRGYRTRNRTIPHQSCRISIGHGISEVGIDDPGKNCDDRHRHHEFDERKPVRLVTRLMACLYRSQPVC